MKNINRKLYPILLLGLTVLLGSCEDDNLGNKAEIIDYFTVSGTLGDSPVTFNAVINDDHTVTIKVSPQIDANEALQSAVATFCLSKGATVTPDPSTPQNFAQSGGVKYTVTSEDGKHVQDYTVSWGMSDLLEPGEGFGYAELSKTKDFTQLGYPGELKNFDLPDSKQYGDLQMYHAYCGDHIVLLSKAYIESDPASPYGITVVDKENLNPAGSLNLGSIPVTALKLITSDYMGRCVGAVVENNTTEIFYWKKPADAPTSIGKIGINMASTTDGSANIQVAGDITANAWITAMAPRSAKGGHYRVKVSNGTLASDYSTIETGYSSEDCTGFQMISPLDDSDQPRWVVADTEGTAGQNNTVKAYINTFDGATASVMPPFWQNNLQSWWAGTGATTARVGGRTPASALMINGKTYVVVTSGTGWWHSAAVVSADLQTLSHKNLNIAYGVNRGWSYGSWADWYWDEDKREAYLAIWFGRLGLYTYKFTCYE